MNKQEVAKRQAPVYEVSYQSNGQDLTISANDVAQFIKKGDAGVTVGEIKMFLNLCKYQGLNPFLNEAYLVKYSATSPAQIVTGKEAFMKRAEKNENYDGLEAGIIIERNNEVIKQLGYFTLEGDKLLGGWAKVYRKDRKYPSNVEVSLKEYFKAGNGKNTWSTMPATMIRKVALVHAMREAFPVELGAMYTEEELGEPISDAEEVKHEIKEKANKKVIDISYTDTDGPEFPDFAEYDEAEEETDEVPF